MQKAISNSDVKFFRNWLYNRKLGIVKYAFINGVVYGILLFIFTGLFDLQEKTIKDVYFGADAIVRFLFWLTFGVLGYGLTMWWLNQYFFKKRLLKYELREEELISYLKTLTK